MTQLFRPHLAAGSGGWNNEVMAYAAKIERNLVRIVNTANGSTARTISGTYTNAVVQGEELHLTQPNGKIRVVNIKNGSTIRIF
jgi:hypothetical protein